MNQMKSEEATAVAAFRVKLGMARVNAMKHNKSEALKRDSTGHLVDEFDISNLPLPVKKHIITAGILQGDIFQYGDGFACIKEVSPDQRNPVSGKILHLQVRALTHRSYNSAIEVVEILLNEIVEPQKKTLKRLSANRSWARMLKNEFEIQDLAKPVIRHLITNGIIKGDIFQSSGAVVSTQGSPYMTNDVNLSARPIYLLIQGPHEKAQYYAVESIKKLIREAKELMNDEPEVILMKNIQPTSEQSTHQQACEPESQPKELMSNLNTSEVIWVDDNPPEAVVAQEKYFQPFMPQLGEGVEADVERCAVLVQWLLAHPLLVSFMVCPPKDLSAKKVSRQLAVTALLSLPLYDQYAYSHNIDCQKFFSKAREAAYLCCEAVVSSGYDISKLMSVDDYVKDLCTEPEQIGVLYDYPLPMNLFYMDSSRLFIDLVINCGLEIDESHIIKYLRATTQWYPDKAFQKIVAPSQVDPYSPSKNPKTHQYLSYRSIDHQGGLINFRLETLGNAAPGRLFPPDAGKIPRCEYFPFLKKLTVFSKLCNISKKPVKVPETACVSGSISQAAYQMTREALGNSDTFGFQQPLPSYEAHDGNASQQQFQPVMMPGFSMPPAQTPFVAALPSTSSQLNLSIPSGNPQNASGHPPIGNVENPSPLSFIPRNVIQSSSSHSNSPPVSFQPQSKSEVPRQETQELQKLPPSFLTMQDPKSNQGGIVKKQEMKKVDEDEEDKEKRERRVKSRYLRKQRKQEERERKQQLKKEEVAKTLEVLQEKYGGNNFWTVNRNLEAENTSRNITNLSVPQKNSSNFCFANTQPQTSGTMQFLTSPLLSQNLEQALQNMQMSMPTAQPTLFGVPSVQLGEERKPILKQPLLNTEKILEGEPNKNDSHLSHDSSQQHSFTEVISKLREYIQGSTKVVSTDSEDSTTASVDEETSAHSLSTLQPSTLQQSTLQHSAYSAEQCTASNEPPDESPFAAIIQQLKQYIDSNTKNSSPDDVESKKPSGDEVREPVEPIASDRKPAIDEQKPESSFKAGTQQEPDLSLKRPSTDYKSETQPKRVCIEAKTNYIQQNPGPSKTSLFLNSQTSNTFSVNGNLPKDSNTFHSVSILGDSLLQGARARWGGSANRDCRKDSYTLTKLHSDVVGYHSRYNKLLNPYCVLMCGVNDVIKKTLDKNFVLHLKTLLNFLVKKKYHVFVVTLPLMVSSSQIINNKIPAINGFISSFHTKPNITVIPFHKFYQECNNKKSLLKSICVLGKAETAVLSDFACDMVRDMIEVELIKKRIK